MKLFTATSFFAIVATAGLSISAAAQDGAPDDQVVSVYERSRPDYSAPGARTGSFLFLPTIEGGLQYNSNIFASRAGPTNLVTGEVDDFIVKIKPGFNLTSDWNQHFFSVSADADIARYIDNSREDFEDINLGAQGRIDISRGTSFKYGASYSDLHEDRGSPDNPGRAAEQTLYNVFRANAGFVRDLALVSLAVDGNYEKTNYDDARLLDANGDVSGNSINNDDRDRERWEGSVRLGYEVDEYYETFIRLKANSVTYDNSQADGGPQRNSDGYEIVAGATFDLTGKSQGEFFGGYVAQNYDSDTLSNVGDFTFGASLLWNPTGLTSVRGSVSRSVAETIVSETVAGNNVFAAGILGTVFDLQMEHELQRNVLLKGTATYTRQSYENIGRSDDLYAASLGLRYLLNRNFAVDASYNFDSMDTTETGQDFKRHNFMVSLRSQW